MFYQHYYRVQQFQNPSSSSNYYTRYTCYRQRRRYLPPYRKIKCLMHILLFMIFIKSNCFNLVFTLFIRVGSNSITILSYCNLLKYCNKYCFDIKYCNKYCKISKYCNEYCTIVRSRKKPYYILIGNNYIYIIYLGITYKYYCT